MSSRNLHRDFEQCVISFARTERPVGRPGPLQSLPKKIAVVACNFVFRVVGRAEGVKSPWDASSADPWAGWLLEVNSMQSSLSHGKRGIGDAPPCSQHSKRVYLRTAQCFSKVSICKAFSQMVEGGICDISSAEFHRFVREDTSFSDEIADSYSSSNAPAPARDGKSLRVFQILDYCGRHGGVWVFPEAVFDVCGRRIADPDVFVTRDSLQQKRAGAHGGGASAALPSIIRSPPVHTSEDASLRALQKVIRSLRTHFASNFPQALHMVARAWIAVHRSEILDVEKQLSIVNISGPPNVGKTLLCNLVCKMLSCECLILSRTTPSSMLNYANAFHDLMVVWDDPRDLTQAVLESIVHEAFHASSTTTNAHGERRYNSSLVIGTQTTNMGMPLTAATCSRISYVRFEKTDTGTSSASDCLTGAEHCFARLVRGAYAGGVVARVDELQADMQRRAPDVLGRAVRSIALDVAAMEHVLEIAQLRCATATEAVDRYAASLLRHASEIASERDSVTRFVLALHSAEASGAVEEDADGGGLVHDAREGKGSAARLPASCSKRNVSATADGGTRQLFWGVCLPDVVAWLNTKSAATAAQTAVEHGDGFVFDCDALYAEMKASYPRVVCVQKNVNYGGIIRRSVLMKESWVRDVVRTHRHHQSDRAQSLAAPK